MRNFIKVLTIGVSAAAMMAFTPPGGKKPKYIDKANMDAAVKPGENFYLFANGGWLKNNPVPSSKTRWGSFDMLREESSKRMQTLLQEASKKAATNSRMQKIGDFYLSGMDTVAIDQLGYEPIKIDLQRIDAIRNLDDLLQEIAYEKISGTGSPLFGFFLAQDRKNVTQYIPQLTQGGTSLPDRDYYLKNDARSTAIRKAFVDHLEKMFRLIGESEADAIAHAAVVMRIETALAKAQMSRVEMRDPYKTYNKFSVKDFSATTASIDWSKMLQQLKLNGADSLVVTNPSFFKSVDVLLSAVSLQDWKTYLKWGVLDDAAAYLSMPFVKQNFAMTQVLTGQKEITPRWQFVSGIIDGQLGDLLGQLYVDKYFKPEAKTRMMDLVNNLQQTFSDRIRQLDWMSDETKSKALEKLFAFTKKIGYPDKWKDYNSISIDKNDFMGNIHRTSQWAYDDMIARFGKPVDKTRWGMTPPTINAYYNSVNNEIAFPAGILQFPFFDFGADDAVNYGGIGAAIGHEMTHGFDDNGSQYAADGNLKNWWTNDDETKFKAKANLVVEQYNAFTVLDTLHVNGKLTLGENIADLGGLNIAYEAFTKTKQFKEGKSIDGFTPAQRFFLSWAQVWRSNTLPEAQAQLILTDSHSPGMHRANGPIVNMEAWYQAFNIQPGDKMYKAPEQRIRIW
ncbi:M13 family metallopeptidase [Chitinophagaceae bacterium LB-8]|uniref:M13 family metallopeptidase n=1 Tax=Paraflavisolibacter caeni TaxID=2982496 RepID=A0A9X3B9R1_9BACT|nr:M13 family metallopeptidase [Paraflavisolibacter caeni]MCU7551646.1 M13 family metallopeptidase [Paraflavisolibacter caeni]